MDCPCALLDIQGKTWLLNGLAFFIIRRDRMAVALIDGEMLKEKMLNNIAGQDAKLHSCLLSAMYVKLEREGLWEKFVSAAFRPRIGKRVQRWFGPRRSSHLSSSSTPPLSSSFRSLLPLAPLLPTLGSPFNPSVPHKACAPISTRRTPKPCRQPGQVGAHSCCA